MNVESQLELVMMCNLTARTQLNRINWLPVGTSTPVRKPLSTLINVEPSNIPFGDGASNKVQKTVLSKKDSKEQNNRDNTKVIVKKKRIKGSRNLISSDDEDDDDDDVKGSQDGEKSSTTQKKLIIKLGPSKCNVRSVKKKPVSDTLKNRESPCYRDERKLKSCNKKDFSPCTVASNKGRDRSSKSEISSTFNEKCVSKKLTFNSHRSPTCETIPNNVEPLSNIVEDGKTSNDLVGDQYTSTDNISSNKTESIVSQKRKNPPSCSRSLLSKKQKNEHESNNDSDKLIKVTHQKLDITANKELVKEKENKGIEILSRSHEIFSDSRYKEYRDSLVLTDEDEVLNQNSSEGVKEKYVHKPKSMVTKVTNLSVDKDSITTSREQKLSESQQNSRPRREKKSPKEFWLPRAENSKSFESTRVHDFKLKNTERISSTTNSVEDSDKASFSGDQVCGFPSDSTDFVKDLSELVFTETSNGFGNDMYSVALGWNFPKFKCCALKIGVKCTASNRTKQKNSHFGGVLLKGKLLLNIEDQEIKMKAGQMFYVPPLKDWRAQNIGKTECLVYYWCGKW